MAQMAYEPTPTTTRDAFPSILNDTFQGGSPTKSEVAYGHRRHKDEQDSRVNLKGEFSSTNFQMLKTERSNNKGNSRNRASKVQYRNTGALDQTFSSFMTSYKLDHSQIAVNSQAGRNELLELNRTLGQTLGPSENREKGETSKSKSTLGTASRLVVANTQANSPRPQLPMLNLPQTSNEKVRSLKGRRATQGSAFSFKRESFGGSRAAVDRPAHTAALHRRLGSESFHHNQ